MLWRALTSAAATRHRTPLSVNAYGMEHPAKLWRRDASLESLNAMGANSLVHHVGIRFECVGDDFLEASMPVDGRTVQPFGILHGGASLVLAETLASVAAYLCVDEGRRVVGVEINANHLRRVQSGRVTGRATPVSVGARIHVWQVEIVDESGVSICVARTTLVVIEA